MSSIFLNEFLKENISDFSLKEAANKFDINLSTFESYYFNRSNPSYKNFIKIANYFDASLDYLIRGNNCKYVRNIKFLAHASQLDSLSIQDVEKVDSYIDIYLDLRKAVTTCFDELSYSFTDDFNDNFRLLISEKNLTEKQAASELNISVRQVASYKKNTECPYDVLCKISDKYNISIHWLITGKKLSFDFDIKKFKKHVLQADRYLDKKHIDMTTDLIQRILKKNNNKVMSN